MDFDDYEIDNDMSSYHQQELDEERKWKLTHLLDLWWLAGISENTQEARQRVLRLAEKAGLLNEFKQSIAN